MGIIVARVRLLNSPHKGRNNFVADALSRNPVVSNFENDAFKIEHVVCVLLYSKPTDMISSDLALQQLLERQLRPIITFLK